MRFFLVLETQFPKVWRQIYLTTLTLPLSTFILVALNKPFDISKLYNCVGMDSCHMWKDTQPSHLSRRIVTVPWKVCRMAQMWIFLCPHNEHSTVAFTFPLTHTEVWTFLLIAAAMSVVTQLVEPVVFGCYEEVPGQQGADAHQKEDDVYQTVRVLWAVAHGQRHWGMFGQEWCRGALVLALLILRYTVVAGSSRHIRGVETGLHRLCLVHFHVQITQEVKTREKREGWGVKSTPRQEVLNKRLWRRRKKNVS